ncbi:DUF1816 domain-containing protein [Fischerella thermalis]|uniref:DUF1816 domain-containing protein n=1 Tax=Fischerella thermalis CCMEE 5318 TaxID=2019666 RepID=A0A2N6L5W1_9CYAN|nr:DUF1816 domain-containing protein [Fischerella thermalis]PMB17234.1 hypothetical protein CEN46_24020 [Fischerella thermalis CCMEE 5318]
MEYLERDFDDEIISKNNFQENSQSFATQEYKPDSFIQEKILDFLEIIGLAWWIEVVTKNPTCTYYFGPFISANKAQIEKNGYVEDLIEEGAIIFHIEIKRCRPQNLTLFAEE